MNLLVRNYQVAVWAVGPILLSLAGCSSTPPPPENQPPAADAGSDQSASGGAEVILDAGDSADPDGDELSFSWTQTAGTSVRLQNAGNARATFVAPNTSSTFRFVVEVFDEAGLSSIDTVNVTVAAIANIPPTASAGSDRHVQGGDFVLLDGTGSADPENGVLRFSWIQTSGPPVELFDAEAASASFLAPNVDTELQLQLTVTDEADQSDTDDMVITIGSVPSVLLVVNQLGDNIASFSGPELADGDVPPDADLSGAMTTLNTPRDVAVTRTGAVIIANSGDNSLLLYLGTDEIDGDSEPLLTVQGPSTGIDQPASLAYSASFDLVFVLNIGAQTDILAFAGPSRVVFDGDLAPVFTFPSAELNAPSNIFLDQNDRLYVANSGARNILVFQQAAQGGAVVELARIITSPAFVSPTDVFVDSSDRLFVVDSDGRVLVFHHASNLSGVSEPVAVISITGARLLSSIAIDRSGTAFLADVDASAILVVDDIAATGGEVEPDRIIIGSATELDRPVRLLLSEP